MEYKPNTSHYEYKFYDREGRVTYYTCYPNRPPCTFTELNKPNIELMARTFRKLLYSSYKKEIRQQIEKEIK